MSNERDRNLVQRGATALRVGDLAAAERFCREVLEHAPDDSEALNVLGAVAFTRRDFEEAERLFRIAATADAQNLGALFNLGKVCEVRKHFDAAADAYAKILRAEPGNAETRVRLGIVRYEQGLYAEAASMFEKVLRADPANRLAALSLGITLNASARYKDSVDVLRTLLALEPELVEAYHALADSLYELHRPEEAAQACHDALIRNPNDVQALVLLGQAEAERGDFANAERLFRQASAFAPLRHEPPMNLGVIFQRLGRIDEAIAFGEQAVELAPDDPLTHLNYGMALLLAGNFKAGWPELEWRVIDRKMQEHFPYRDRLPLWTGERLRGREVLIAREQGIGDFILMSRFFEMAKSHDARVVVEVPPELASLYDEHPGIDELVVGRCSSERLGSFVAHLPMGSLPFVLGINEATIPKKVPYLLASRERSDRFRSLLADRDGLSVGIVWSGNPEHLLDRYRSCPLDAFRVLGDLEGVIFVSLQKGSAEREAREQRDGFELLDWGPMLRDFDDTAGAINALDLIVAVDTSVAHLAGALGKDVWLLNGFGSYWLWQLERSDSPWYPTMRLFRQRGFNEWDDLFSDVRSALEDRIRSRIRS